MFTSQTGFTVFFLSYIIVRCVIRYICITYREISNCYIFNYSTISRAVESLGNGWVLICIIVSDWCRFSFKNELLISLGYVYLWRNICISKGVFYSRHVHMSHGRVYLIVTSQMNKNKWIWNQLVSLNKLAAANSPIVVFCACWCTSFSVM